MKKLLSLALALCMCLSLLPAAKAENNPQSEEPFSEEISNEENVSSKADAITVEPSEEVPENGWYNDGAHLFYFEAGEALKNQIRKISGHLYGFTSNGWMLDGEAAQIDNSLVRAQKGGELLVNKWFSEENEDGVIDQYYYGTNGIGMVGYVSIDGHRYLFNDTGKLYYPGTYVVSNCVYVVDDHCYAVKLREGWYQVNGNWYYCTGENYYKSQSSQINGDWYAFDEQGRIYRDTVGIVYDINSEIQYVRAKTNGLLYVCEWVEIENGDGEVEKYYYGECGYSAKGYQKVDDKYHLFEETGKLLRAGTYFDGDYSYAVRENGYTTKLNRNGWTRVIDSTYYCIAGKYICNCVYQINNIMYCFDQCGKMIANQLVYSHEMQSSLYDFFYAGEDGKLALNKWIAIDSQWFYFGSDYHMYRNGTYLIDGQYYSFNDKGECTNRNGDRGWVQLDNKWRYILEDGTPARNWIKISGKWYFFDPDDCTMATGKKEIDGKLYYFNASGVMQSAKWVQQGSDWLYVKASGELTVGWAKISNKWYYFDASGIMLTGTQTIDGQTYVFNDSGVMQANKWIQSGSDWYYLNGSGSLSTGWQKVGSAWYYFNGEGVMLTGKQSIDGAIYFFNGSGAMQAGKWYQDGADWYYLASSGAAYQSKWLKSGGKWYYFDADGVMLASTSREISGKVYEFNASGVCTNP